MTRSVKLFEERGATSIFISASIDKNGDLLLEGHDIGEAPERHWGDTDYEYWVIVKRPHLPAAERALKRHMEGESGPPAPHLRRAVRAFWGEMRGPDEEPRGSRVLELVRRVYEGDASAVSRFMALLGEHGVPYEFGSWV